MADFNELSISELDKVAGGTLNKFQKSQLRSALAKEKKNNKTKEEVKLMVPGLYAQYSPLFPGVTEKDIYDYIEENWDNL